MKIKNKRKNKAIKVSMLTLALAGLLSSSAYVQAAQTTYIHNDYYNTNYYTVENTPSGNIGETLKVINFSESNSKAYIMQPGLTCTAGLKYNKTGIYPDPKISYMILHSSSYQVTQAAIWKYLGYNVKAVNGASMEDVDNLINKANTSVEADGAYYYYKGIISDSNELKYSYDSKTNTYYSQYFTLKDLYSAYVSYGGYFQNPKGENLGNTISKEGTYRIVYSPNIPGSSDSQIQVTMRFNGTRYESIVYECPNQPNLVIGEMSFAEGGKIVNYPTYLSYVSFPEFVESYVGDINNDGILTVIDDANAIASYVSCKYAYDDSIIYKMDFNSDGRISMKDAQEMYLYLVPYSIIGDMNSNNTLDKNDLTILQNYISNNDYNSHILLMGDLNQSGDLDNQDAEILEKIINSKGDMNLDGFTNSTDAAMVLDLFKNGGAKQLDYYLGDLNNDKILNSTDASMILDVFKNS